MAVSQRGCAASQRAAAAAGRRRRRRSGQRRGDSSRQAPLLRCPCRPPCGHPTCAASSTCRPCRPAINRAADVEPLKLPGGVKARNVGSRGDAPPENDRYLEAFQVGPWALGTAAVFLWLLGTELCVAVVAGPAFCELVLASVGLGSCLKCCTAAAAAPLADAAPRCPASPACRRAPATPPASASWRASTSGCVLLSFRVWGSLLGCVPWLANLRGRPCRLLAGGGPAAAERCVHTLAVARAHACPAAFPAAAAPAPGPAPFAPHYPTQPAPLRPMPQRRRT